MPCAPRLQGLALDAVLRNELPHLCWPHDLLRLIRACRNSFAGKEERDNVARCSLGRIWKIFWSRLGWGHFQGLCDLRNAIDWLRLEGCHPKLVMKLVGKALWRRYLYKKENWGDHGALAADIAVTTPLEKLAVAVALKHVHTTPSVIA